MLMRAMTLDQLKMFKEVADLGSLRAASEALHKTQPAISQGIKHLEQQLGLSLFDRDTYRLQMTDAGVRIYQHALRVLREASSLEQVARHMEAGNEARITLAFEASFDLSAVMGCLESTQADFPGTQIVLRQEFVSGAIDNLTDGRADIVISPGDNAYVQISNVEMALLGTGQLVDVAAPKLLARHPNLKFAQELIDEYQIVVQDSGAGTGKLEFGVQDGQRRWYVNDFHTKRMMILSGMGWGKLPRHLVQADLDSGVLHEFQLSDRVTLVNLNYYAMKIRSKIFGPVARQLWASLQDASR